jgi:hypothetical protein
MFDQAALFNLTGASYETKLLQRGHTIVESGLLRDPAVCDTEHSRCRAVLAADLDFRSEAQSE